MRQSMCAFCIFVAFLWFTSPGRADVPALKMLNVRRSGDTTYFHVRFDAPGNMHIPTIKPGPYGEYERRRLALQPRLVPQDGKTWAVYPRLDVPHFKPAVQFDAKMDLPPIKGLEFVGKVRDREKARFRLLYPTSSKEKPPAGIRDKELAELLRPVRWAEAEIELDFREGEAPAEPRHPQSARQEPRPPRPPKAARLPQVLKLCWAQAQSQWLAIQETLAPEFGFHGFACAATGRKYGVTDPVLEGERKKGEEHIRRRMLDLTTGTTAITQSLALKRLREPGARAPAERVWHIAKVPGITIAEHPWEKMMAGKKPAGEPLAALVPHDNYYIRFKSFAKFIEMQDLLDQWGTPAGRAYEVLSREHGLKERYERQLCLKSTWLGRHFGPLLVKSVAITGNDPYIREGSDITVIFHVTNRQAFLAGVEPFLKEARKEFGADLRAGKDQHLGIAIESFVTPLREVSVHRAVFDDFVVYSNSPVGLRRVLDVHKGKAPALAKSLDFQYMRTVFRADDKEEDGFAFLSDAFIRQLVGPASKIKEMRRLEALTSLSMLTHGALFTAWETGKLPASHDALLSASALSPEHLYVPEGKPPRWDAARQTAVSDVYNTIHFATPLVELPIDKVTGFEEKTYRDFREEYQKLWRQFFDPVGIRLALTKTEAKVEVYLLPMVNSAPYRDLRNMTSTNITRFDPARISSRSVMQLTMSYGLNFFRSIGDWMMIRLDDNRTLGQLGEWWIRKELLPMGSDQPDEQATSLILQLPITMGVGIKNRFRFVFDDKRQILELVKILFGPTAVRESEYKETNITQVTFGPKSKLVQNLNQQLSNGSIQEVVIHHAVIDDGWYVSFDKTALHDLIDRTIERKQKKAKAETIPINASLYIAPKAAKQSGASLRQYLEWETHKRALPNNALWEVLHRANLLDEKSPAWAKRQAALRFLGFLPVSPDDAAYRYDPARGEVVNLRHGSLRQPKLHDAIAADSPLVGLLDQFPSLRVDLRFREDGFHSTITVERK